MIRPSARGLLIALRSVVVIRGGRKPLVELSTSSIAEASGVVVPIPTWAKVVKLTANNAAHKSNFFIFLFFNKI
jgi:hypothetical protein